MNARAEMDNRTKIVIETNNKDSDIVIDGKTLSQNTIYERDLNTGNYGNAEERFYPIKTIYIHASTKIEGFLENGMGAFLGGLLITSAGAALSAYISIPLLLPIAIGLGSFFGGMLCHTLIMGVYTVLRQHWIMHTAKGLDQQLLATSQQIDHAHSQVVAAAKQVEALHTEQGATAALSQKLLESRRNVLMELLAEKHKLIERRRQLEHRWLCATYQGAEDLLRQEAVNDELRDYIHYQDSIIGKQAARLASQNKN